MSRRLNVETFDASGLERAAAALKEINASPHAGAALELQMQTAKTKQSEAKQEQSKQDNESWDKKKDYLEKEFQEKKKLSDYEDTLARKRSEDDRQASAEAAKAQQLMREEHARRIEGLKRRTEQRMQEERRLTIEKEAAQKAAEIRTEQLAKAEGEMRRERYNHDINLEKVVKGKLAERQTYVDATVAAVKGVGELLGGFIRDADSLTRTVALAGGLFLAFHGTKAGAKVAANVAEAAIGRPSLLRETSRRSWLNPSALFERKLEAPSLRDIVLPPAQFERATNIAAAMKSARERGVSHRNLLLHGPPGTGKTMLGRALAAESGMDYAVMTGGDVVPLGKDGVTELHKLFGWAKQSRKGLILFMDEAEAFLRKRDGNDLGEEVRSALNAFLYHTGTESKNVMLVLATNQPQLLDRAVVDRIDTHMLFSLPGSAERAKILDLGWQEQLAPLESSMKVRLPPLTPVLLEALAGETRNMSSRQLVQLINSIQHEAFAMDGKQGEGEGAVMDQKQMLEMARLKMKEANELATGLGASIAGS